MVAFFDPFYSRSTETGPLLSINRQIIPVGRFWVPDRVAVLGNFFVPSGSTKHKEKPGDFKAGTHPKLKLKNTLRAPVRTHAGPLRVVHLDLKGAAPKVSYFQQVREHP